MKRTLLILLLAIMATSFVLIRPAPSAGSQSPTPIKDFVGINAVVNNNPEDIAQVAAWVRDYHKWYWYEPVDDDYRWSQSWQYLDRFYSSLEAAGVKVMPDVEKAPDWATSNGSAEGIPNASEHAEYMGALASHYGDTIAAVENFNEPDKCCSNGKFAPDAFGNMAGLDFEAVGAANPSVIKVLAGLSNANTSYLDRVYQAGGNRCDVINFHWYAAGDTVLGGRESGIRPPFRADRRDNGLAGFPGAG